MDNKINEAINYYSYQKESLIKYINENNNLKVEEIIEKAEELSILEYKITALEVALEN
ncbi:hypothetical protein L3X37_00590 [Sabulilitoribacter arenilitoris]|uniref:Uncharacterized protein n=1 Tax=Wocania arenilitoris TaxID=2044858 RepID=A0AAE3EL51_9FLAO|nr:hypothetical protein [Wocania arenilitoris]MCF7566862.1 hypothetical protein [Wocania arenilitoris]